MVHIPRAIQAHQLALAPSQCPPVCRRRMDSALALPAPVLVHRLRQSVYLLEERVAYFQEDDEHSRRTWLRIPVAHPLARYESEFFSTVNTGSARVSKCWDRVEARKIPLLRLMSYYDSSPNHWHETHGSDNETLKLPHPTESNASRLKFCICR